MRHVTPRIHKALRHLTHAQWLTFPIRAQKKTDPIKAEKKPVIHAELQKRQHFDTIVTTGVFYHN